MKPVVLIIRDGWGENHNPAHDKFNAIKLAKLPVSNRLSQEWPRTEIAAHGLDVGLPVGIMGNSEVGHQNIGAGRIVDQEIVRIDKGLDEADFKNNAAFCGALDKVRKTGGKLHFFGLASAAGVHSTLPHLYSLLQHTKAAGVSKVFIHTFMDGRDSPPTSGLGFIQEIENKLQQIGIGKIASVSGRFWAMDRDNRWERVQKAYDALTGGPALEATSAAAATQAYYDKPLDSSRQGDEFILPTRIVSAPGTPLATIEDGDSVIFFNFRGDRPREITRSFIDADFNGFARAKKLDIFFATMTEYQKGLCPNVLFHKPPKMKNILGEWVAQRGIAQFRTAETEKYPHVTFFFNDYREEPFPDEDREVVPSPKEVATYDLKPEMSSEGVTSVAKAAILSGRYGLIVINYANADMVGHTGSLDAAIKSCEAVDKGLGELLTALDKVGGKALVCADHGNSDQMWEPEASSPHTRHTLNPVEVVLYGDGLKGKKMKPLNTGRLADIAPTLLALMGLEQPAEMTGQSLLA
ncbi:MAG: 2,3-bisphosphoglycerate-independent phosphoglycerate mutase [Puniceicoccales bacterium]|jgi:2,3-bisphosphoglycerate-independent phosphoglycerate mutase|nr:2,3-bisphosphoglycerate-independent phosphoglycerate mutase [Puniceicoccales bacterium]